MKRGALVVAAMVTALCAGVAGQVGKGLLDPNRAAEQELLAVPHLNPTIVRGVLERRPFLSMSDLNAYLIEQGLTREQLTDVYRQTFIHLNLNTATAEEILLIPNLGKRMLHEFLEYRPYKAMAQFRREMGKYVNDAEVKRLEQYVFVPIDLNTASDADILTIPGVDQRLLHEFKEYRPYKSLEQFRREIGKYVDRKEVARLERYVTIE